MNALTECWSDGRGDPHSSVKFHAVPPGGRASSAPVPTSSRGTCGSREIGGCVRCWVCMFLMARSNRTGLIGSGRSEQFQNTYGITLKSTGHVANFTLLQPTKACLHAVQRQSPAIIVEAPAVCVKVMRTHQLRALERWQVLQTRVVLVNPIPLQRGRKRPGRVRKHVVSLRDLHEDFVLEPA